MVYVGPLIIMGDTHGDEVPSCGVWLCGFTDECVCILVDGVAPVWWDAHVEWVLDDNSVSTCEVTTVSISKRVRRSNYRGLVERVHVGDQDHVRRQKVMHAFTACC